MQIARALSLLLLCCILCGAAFACRGSLPEGFERSEDGQPRLEAEQSVLWETPAAPPRQGSFRTDSDGNQYYFDWSGTIASYTPGRVLRWDYEYTGGWFEATTQAGHMIRVVEEERGESWEDDLYYVTAIGREGEVLWRTLLDNGGGYMLVSGLQVTSDGWTFVLQSGILVPDQFDNSILGLSPQGSIAWSAGPTLADPDSLWTPQFEEIKLDSNGDLLALDNSDTIYRFDREGVLIGDSSDAVDPDWDRISLASVGPRGAFVLDAKLDTIDYVSLGQLPEYFTTGVETSDYHGTGDCLLLFDAELELVWESDTRSMVTCVVPRPAGGVFVGGMAGEVAAFDDGGDELWRVMPDQRRDAERSWRDRFPSLWSFDWDPGTAVKTMLGAPQGGVVVSTETGLLYMAGADGQLRWEWPYATTSGGDAGGYGVRPIGYRGSRASSGLAWAADGNLLCAAGSTLLTIDPATGELVDIETSPTPRVLREAADGTLRTGAGFSFLALDRQGAELWSVTLPDSISAYPLLDGDGCMYVPTVRGLLHKISAAGAIEWAVALPAMVKARPVLGADGNVYAVDVDGNLVAVSPAGSLLWTQSGMNCDNIGPASGPGGLAVLTADGAMAFVDYCGTLRWEFPLANAVLAPAAVDGLDRVVFGDETGIVYGVGPDGEALFTHVDSPTAGVFAYGHGLEVSQPPLIMPDGNIVVELASAPFYGCVQPQYSYTAVKCLAWDGSTIWQHPAAETRLADYGHDINLVLPQPLSDEWVLLWAYPELMLVSQDGTCHAGELSEDLVGFWGSGRQTIPAQTASKQRWSVYSTDSGTLYRTDFRLK